MKIKIIVPCYNEEEVLQWAVETLGTVIERINTETGADADLLLVDDGSKDTTWNIIKDLSAKHSFVSGIKLAHNSGHQNALWAGLEYSVDKCDAMVSIDADLQDDENVIVDMVKQVQQGADIVYGVRKERKTDSFFKRFTAQTFYKLMQSADKDMLYNHADFRMMSSRAVEALLQYGERNLFLRGIVRKLGFNEGFVYYDRKARTAGESKYPLKKMLAFALDGITSFSVKPIRLILNLGVVIFAVSVLILLYSLIRKLCGQTVSGWTSLVCSIWALGGIQLLALGVIGEYIGKIYNETKRRPRYIIETVLDDEVKQ